jgi:hypothetical protein
MRAKDAAAASLTRGVLGPIVTAFLMKAAARYPDAVAIKKA